MSFAVGLIKLEYCEATAAEFLMLSNNQVEHRLGMVYMSNSKLNILSSNIEGNVEFDKMGEAPIFYLYRSTLNADHSTFERNEANTTVPGKLLTLLIHI